MNTRCAVVRMRLPGVDSVDDLGDRLSAHVGICLRCQAEAARYRTLRRHLGALSRDELARSATLVPRLLRASSREAAESTTDLASGCDERPLPSPPRQGQPSPQLRERSSWSDSVGRTTRRVGAFGAGGACGGVVRIRSPSSDGSPVLPGLD